MKARGEFVEFPINKAAISQRRPVCGVGINDATYLVGPRINGKQTWCPYYSVWLGMIKRCYSEKEIIRRNDVYRDCHVSKDWLSFSNFKKWMNIQDWEDNQLDKDILIPGNKEYSSDACVFVPLHVNTLLTDHRALRGDYPQGVSFHKRVKRFLVKCNKNNKQRHIGYFDTVEQASTAYRKSKSEEIKRVADTQPDKIKLALYRHADQMEHTLC